MKYYFYIPCLLFFVPKTLKAWGFYAHEQINKHAVYCLPPEMFGFYKIHQQYLMQHATDPDKRRYLVKGEDVKHFIDLDHYEQRVPIDTMPFAYAKAIEKFGKDTLWAYGIVPWNIQWVLNQLTEAFTKHDVARVLKLSAELGHYVADAHVPLHTTQNYNGQLTNQHGIHSFFESRLPELFFEEYDFFVGSADYLSNPQSSIWRCIEQSFKPLSQVFELEKQTKSNLPEWQWYEWIEKNGRKIRQPSQKWSQAYHKALKGLVEARLQAAVLAVASFWLTAWVDAGQPNLYGWQPGETPLFVVDSVGIHTDEQKFIRGE